MPTANGYSRSEDCMRRWSVTAPVAVFTARNANRSAT